MQSYMFFFYCCLIYFLFEAIWRNNTLPDFRKVSAGFAIGVVDFINVRYVLKEENTV